jgi:hypothetical protein
MCVYLLSRKADRGKELRHMANGNGLKVPIGLPQSVIALFRHSSTRLVDMFTHTVHNTESTHTYPLSDLGDMNECPQVVSHSRLANIRCSSTGSTRTRDA